MTFSTASSQYSEQGNFAIFLEAIASDRQRLWLTRAESGTALGWSDVLSGWQQNPEFRQLFTQSLADLPYAAFFWETPPLSGETLLLPFECCVIDSPRLAEVTAAPEAFAGLYSAAIAANRLIRSRRFQVLKEILCWWFLAGGLRGSNTLTWQLLSGQRLPVRLMLYGKQLGAGPQHSSTSRADSHSGLAPLD
ncbi:MAG: hypothetical protein HC839_00445 [Leptolyngbyaceae cyanobacterium RM2_2_21]|nr:hypothetical protein [Leptolyngbyaceae cyanobacterium RM2_2_21]